MIPYRTFNEKNGGPAFPVTIPFGCNAWHGMTLQDFFAAAALTGMYAGGATYPNPRDAYEIADEMIQERERLMTIFQENARAMAQESAVKKPELENELGS